MITDKTPRWLKSLDAVSQFLNVTFLAGHERTTSNESISGRAHRSGWAAERLIDALFFPIEGPGHCRRSYHADVERARCVVADADSTETPR